MQSRPCFECGSMTTGKHHVVPRSLGGKRTVPLCFDCHNKVTGEKTIHWHLLMAGLKRARESGKVLGAPVRATGEASDMVMSLRSSGKSVREIGGIIDLSVGTIHKIIRERGDPLVGKVVTGKRKQNNGGAPFKVTESLKDIILTMKSCGSTIREISIATNLSVGTVHGVIRKNKGKT